MNIALFLNFSIAKTAGTLRWLETSWQIHCLLGMLWMDLDGASSSTTWLLIPKRTSCGSFLDLSVRSSRSRSSEISRPTSVRVLALSPWRITTRPSWLYRASTDTPWATESSKFRSRPTSARHKSSSPCSFAGGDRFFPSLVLTGVATNIFP